MDGINEAGLAVALLADNESPDPEPTGGPQVGLAEQQIVRYLLDTCATVDEAKEALLLAKQYYFFVPCHFVVADRSGRSFVWEHSAAHNREAIVEGDRFAAGRTVCTNHLLHPRADLTDLPAEDGSLGTAAHDLHALGGPARRPRTTARWSTATTSAATSGPSGSRPRSSGPVRSGRPSMTWRTVRSR